MTSSQEAGALWQWYSRGLCDIVGKTFLPRFQDRHVLSSFFVELEQAACAVPLLAEHGIFNAGRRELRFIVEASVKICWLEQRMPDAELAAKVAEFDGKLKFGLREKLDQCRIDLVRQDQQSQFVADVKALYATMCEHVHPSYSSARLRSHLTDWDEDEGAPERLADFHQLVVRGFGSSVILLLHSLDAEASADCASELKKREPAFGDPAESLDLTWLHTM